MEDVNVKSILNQTENDLKVPAKEGATINYQQPSTKKSGPPPEVDNVTKAREK